MRPQSDKPKESLILPIHTILHPTDFSARARSAFDLACAVARDYDARLVVVHVKPPRMMGGEVHALITTPEEVDRELRGELDKLQPQIGKSYSLCDAISFLLMRERAVREALTTDRYFEQAGFRRLLPDSAV